MGEVAAWEVRESLHPRPPHLLPSTPWMSSELPQLRKSFPGPEIDCILEHRTASQSVRQKCKGTFSAPAATAGAPEYQETFLPN